MLEKLGYGHVISGPAVIMNGNSMASLLTFIRNKGLISISLYSLFSFLGFGSDCSHAYGGCSRTKCPMTVLVFSNL